MAVRPKYPEASNKRNQYRSIAEKLTKHRNEIQSKLNSASRINRSSYETKGLSGQYYDKYLLKLGDWIDDHNDLIKRMNKSLSDLDICIKNAKDKEEYWRKRSTIMEVY